MPRRVRQLAILSEPCGPLVTAVLKIGEHLVPPVPGPSTERKPATLEGTDARTCLELAKEAWRAGDGDGALPWLVRVVDVGESYVDWRAAASLASRILAAGHEFAGVARRAKVWISGSYTTAQFAPLLMLAGLRTGLCLDIHQGGYARFRQEMLDPHSALYESAPDLVLLMLDAASTALPFHSDEPAADIEAELARWRSLWQAFRARSDARLVVHNFAVPVADAFGHLSTQLPGARRSLLIQLNACLGPAAAADGIAVVDCDRLSAELGKTRWFDARYRHLSDQATSHDALPVLARNTARVMAVGLGLAKKCIVLDLDNTLWGGVVGEDGPAGLKVGADEPESRAYLAFQTYLADLKRKGLLLAVCSKNNPDDAREAFSRRPDMVLGLDDFVSFKANWRPKSENLRLIAEELNLGLDAFVFCDDNPAEREIIRQHVPQVDVVDLPTDPAGYVDALATSTLLETAAFTREDQQRTELYQARARLVDAQAGCTSLKDFLASLEMEATLAAIDAERLPRAAQLLAKTNQFNLTGRRYGAAQLSALMADPDYRLVALTLRDRFADHGFVSVLGIRRIGPQLHVDTWVMSCRVLGRSVEAVMMTWLVSCAKAWGCMTIRGLYSKTAKNQPVERLFTDLGFQPYSGAREPGDHYVLDIASCREQTHFVHLRDMTGLLSLVDGGCLDR